MNCTISSAVFAKKYLFRGNLLRDLFILSRKSALSPFSSSKNFVIRKPR